MTDETITLTCSSCGKQIQVPAGLEQFSCVYCGAKLTMEECLPRPACDANEDDLQYVRTHLFDCIRLYPDYYRNFSRKKYEPAFQTYLYGVEEIFRTMDRYVCAKPSQRNALLEGFSDQFLADWEDFHRQGRKKSKRAIEREMFNNKLTLAWFTAPAILQLELSIGPDFTDRLQRKFVQKYPDNIFRVGTYEQIVSGFRKHGLCFITTAVCEQEGKPDDCAELTAFRAFRDGWLSRTPSGRALIEEYYETAPAIVLAMQFCDDSAQRCEQLRQQYLDPCYLALRSDDPIGCKRRYVRMVRDLKKRYRIS